MSLTATNVFQQARQKLFMNQTVYYVQKVGIKRFLAQEAEMSLTATCVFQQA